MSLDTETTGLDLRHGCRPFFVTVCTDEGDQSWWEWSVDPATRAPKIPEGDLDEIEEAIRNAEEVVLHNSKFDVSALASVRPRIGEEWPWDRTHDTLLAGHLLDSASPHDLTSMTLRYLSRDIQPLEKALEAAVKAARIPARKEGWMIAGKGIEGMPSQRERSWGSDMWLPKESWRRSLGMETEWETVLRDYSNADSEATMALWVVLEPTIRESGLWDVYQERRRILSVLYEMETMGLTKSKSRSTGMRSRYQEESVRLEGVCLSIAESLDYDLELPRSGRNKSLERFCFDVLDLPRHRSKKAKTDAPSMDAATMEVWIEETEEGSCQSEFVKSLRTKRRYDTALTYLDGYDRFALPSEWGDDTLVLHPKINPTGTKTLRMSSSDPNEQSISKKEGVNLREAFGPPPGYEWYALDYQNLELRIPAFWAGETDVVELFENPERAPYFGSYHLLIADLLHPELFKIHGVKFKDVFESTWYKRVKCGNFAVIYGAQEETADRTYGVKGAHRRIKKRFPRMAELNAQQMSLAAARGYVETIPDRRVDPNRGYPLRCPTSEWGRISPTIPFNYAIQSTAMQIALSSLVRCHDRIVEWRDQGYWSRAVLQVHDENGFEMPIDTDEVTLPRVLDLKRIMEASGDAVGVPTPVSVTRHRVHWGEGERLDVVKLVESMSKKKPSSVKTRV